MIELDLLSDSAIGKEHKCSYLGVVLENSFLHTGIGYSRVLPGPTILISPMLSHLGPEKNTCIKCIGCIGSHVSTSSSDVGFYSPYVKKMTSIYANKT